MNERNELISHINEVERKLFNTSRDAEVLIESILVLAKSVLLLENTIRRPVSEYDESIKVKII